MFKRPKKDFWYAVSVTLRIVFTILLAVLLLIFFGKLHYFVKTNGQLIPTNEIVISSPITGVIDKVLIKDGSKVSPNIAILIIIPREREASTELEIRIKKKRAEKKLLDNEITQIEFLQDVYSSKEIKKKKSLARSYQQEISELQNLQKFKGKNTITSPIAGQIVGIKDWDTLVGQYVLKGEPIFKVVNPQNFFFKAFVRESDLMKVKKDQPVLVSLWAIPREVFKPIKGKLAYFYPKPVFIDNNTYFPVLCSLNLADYKHKDFLKAGMNGEARIDIGKKRIITMIFKTMDLYN